MGIVEISPVLRHALVASRQPIPENVQRFLKQIKYNIVYKKNIQIKYTTVYKKKTNKIYYNLQNTKKNEFKSFHFLLNFNMHLP